VAKTKTVGHAVDPDDISGRMFRQALAQAHERCAHKTMRLAKALGLQSRSCFNWLRGDYPTYVNMQKIYYLLLEVGRDGV
jgi:hypothetical protein